MHLRTWLVAVALTALGLAHAAPPPVRLGEARRALGGVAQPPGAGDPARLAALARHGLAVGDPELAVDAAQVALGRARVAGDAAAARAAWGELAKVARATQRPGVVLQAWRGGPPVDAAQRADLTWALAHPRARLKPWQRVAATAAGLQGPAVVRAELVAGSTPNGPVPLARLVALGPAAGEALGHRLRSAVEDAPGEVPQVLAALGAVDPLSLAAGVVRTLTAEGAPSAGLVLHVDRAKALPILAKAAQDAGGRPGPSLAFALGLREAGLFGACRTQVQPWLGEAGAVGALAATLDALCAHDGHDDAAFAAWAKGADWARSADLTRRLSRAAWRGADHPVVKAAVRQRLLQGWTTPGVRARLLDPSESPTVRAAVAWRHAAHWGEPTRRICATDHARCEAALAAHAALEDVEGDQLGAWRALSARPGARPDYAALARLARRVDPQAVLAALAAAPPPASAAALEAALVAAARRGDGDAVRAGLAEAGAALPLEVRLVLRLAAKTPTAGLTQAVIAWADAPNWGMGLARSTDARLAERLAERLAAFEGPGPLPALARGRVLVEEGRWRRAAAALTPLRRHLDGPARGLLEGWLAQIHDRAGQGGAARRALTAAQRLAPGAWQTWMATAALAEPKDRAAAHAAFWQAVRVVPHNRPAVLGLLRTLPEGPTFAAARQRALAAVGGHWAVRRVREALTRARTAAQVTGVVTVPSVESLAAIEQGILDVAAWPGLPRWAMGQLAQTPPEARVPFARRVAAVLGERSGRGPRWLRFLAGQPMTAVDLAEGAQDPDAPTALAHLRISGRVDDALALRLWQAERAGGLQALADLLPALSQAAGDDPKLSAWACRVRLNLEQDAQAVAPCAAAWAAGVRTADLAGAVSDLASTRPDTRITPFDDATLDAQLPAEGADAGWGLFHFNRGLIALDRARPAEARRRMARGWRAGFDAPGFRLGERDLATLGPPLTLAQRVRAAAARRRAPAKALTALREAAFGATDWARFDHYDRALKAVAPTEGGSYRDLRAMLAADEAAGLLTAGGAQAVARAIVAESLAPLGDGLAAVEGSTALQAARQLGWAGQRDLSEAEVAALLEAHGGRLVVHRAAVYRARRRGQPRRAKALAKAAVARFGLRVRPDFLAALTADPQAPDRPGWVDEPAAFDAHVADRADPNAGVAFAHGVQIPISLAMPTTWRPAARGRLEFKGPAGARLWAASVTSATVCDPLSCVRDWARDAGAATGALVWARAVRLPGGAGAQGLFATADRLTVLWALPSTDQALYVGLEGSWAAASAVAGAAWVVAQSLDVADRVVGARVAARLRAPAQAAPGVARLAARARLYAGARGCPVSARWREAPHLAPMLADLYLAARTAPERAAVRACAADDDPAAAALALPALLVDDPAGQRLGLRLAKAYPDATLAAAEALLADGPRWPAPRQRPAAAGLHYGLVQVLVALPAAQQHALLERLLAGDDPAMVDLALAGLWQADRRLPEALWLRLLPGADRRRLVAALRVAPHPLPAAARAALAARLVPPVPGESMAVSAARWASARALVRGGGAEGLAAVQAFARSGSTPVHENVGALTAPGAVEPEPPAPSDLRVPARLRAWNLWRLLPEKRWHYGRVGRPAEVLPALAALGTRLSGGEGTIRWLVRGFREAWIRDQAGLLTPGQGLDLSRPVACAEAGRWGRFVCSAHVRDRDQTLARLARREPGRYSPLHQVAQWGRRLVEPELPLSLGLPAELKPPEVGLGERVLIPLAVPGAEAWRMVSVFQRTDGRSVRDVEHALFVGDRVFVVGVYGSLVELLQAPEAAERAHPAGDAGPLRRRWDAGDVVGMAWGTTQAPTEWGALSAHGDDAELHLSAQPAGPDPRVHLPAGATGRWWILGEPRIALLDYLPSVGLLPQGLLPLLEQPPAALAAYPGGGWAVACTPRGFLAAGLRALIQQGQGALYGHAVRWDGPVLVVASSADLLARPRMALAGDADVLPGPLVAKGVRAAGERAKASERMGMLAQAEVLERLVHVAGRRPSAHSVAARLRFAAASPSARPLASLARLRAGIPVRTQLDLAEHEGPLALRFGWRAADQRVDALASHPRVTARALGPDRVLVTVAARRLDTPEPLHPVLAGQLKGPSPDPSVVALAKTLMAPADSASDKASAVAAWLAANMRRSPVTVLWTPGEILAQRRGDCTEFSALAVALLRTGGVPAREVQGLLIHEGRVQAHAWVEFHDGARFQELDPANPGLTVGAAHVPLDGATLSEFITDLDRVVEVTAP